MPKSSRETGNGGEEAVCAYLCGEGAAILCRNYTVIDTKDYGLPGIDAKYRPAVCHLVMHAVTNRIDAHLVELTGHDMSLRRYYRKIEY